ncbi:9240_t:CDS:2 [Cetraspora pellucida]|uniref:9240_t:CDS:1 n=2 Tax=Cetraspora pellucida TaxID=1433469 RepID=A0ACA9K3N7_9GLOM|nr:9236_t:CDS:2 [Cetraspora pellucida]CAG8447748.1 9240_t:CDS:2 [Cetraspora pellucida]
MKANYGEEPPYFNARAIYKINFPPSLWNELTEKQQNLAKKNGHGKLTLREKVKADPVRGEQNPDNPAELDNNALFYGEPRTGKSVMAEKLAYEADCYPLVVIQGSTLTPNKSDTNANVTLLLKFIFTISSITHDLVNNFGYEREEGDGEVRYILFIDEADQICTNNFDPPRIASSQLTFLKECMGSDNKEEESKNLWIAATNHLDNINPADITLNYEDIKHVNRFNKILFDKYFLGKGKDGVIDNNKSFWHKFINHPDTKEQLPEIKEDEVDKLTGEIIIDEKTGKPREIIKQKGIQIGEFLEFFWQKFDNKEIEEFGGKFEKPQKPKIEEVVEETVKLAANKMANDISKVIDTRLQELNKTANQTRSDIESSLDLISTSISQGVEELATHDAYSKHSKRQKEKLALKGKSIEQAQKENERYQKEADELKKKYEENEEKIRDLEKKAQEARSKANDTNLSDEERIF